MSLCDDAPEAYKAIYNVLGHPDKVKAVLEAGNQTTQEYINKSLKDICHSGHGDATTRDQVADLLLGIGKADPSYTASGDDSALADAAFHGRLSIVKKIMAAGCDGSKVPHAFMRSVAASDNGAVMEYFLSEQKQHIPAEKIAQAMDSALYTQHLTSAEKILKAVGPDVALSAGSTLLDKAISALDQKFVDFLLRAGVKPETSHLDRVWLVIYSDREGDAEEYRSPMISQAVHISHALMEHGARPEGKHLAWAACTMCADSWNKKEGKRAVSDLVHHGAKNCSRGSDFPERVSDKLATDAVAYLKDHHVQVS